MENIKLIHGDCIEEMQKLIDEGVKVDCIITSPPYAQQRSYIGSTPAQHYIEWIGPIITKMTNVLSDNGSLVLNIKEHSEKGVKSLYVYELILWICKNTKFRLIDEFIWHKTNPYPTGNKKRLKDGYERCLHFSLTLDYVFNPDSVLVKSTSKYLESEKRRNNKDKYKSKNGSPFKNNRRIVNDLIRPSNVITLSSSNISIAHPAVFPLELPSFFVKLLSNEGQTILDPFMGSGTTGVVSTQLNRKFIGIEITEDYYKLSKERLSQYNNLLF